MWHILDASFIFLFLENYGVRKLEAFFAVLIATMAISFAVMFGETKPSGKELLIGKYHSMHRQKCLWLYCILQKQRSLFITFLIQVWWFQN
jgi:Mn2+/Fe2+ NRAMP family transporter